MRAKEYGIRGVKYCAVAPFFTLQKTRMPSCRWRTRATRNHAKNSSSSKL